MGNQCCVDSKKTDMMAEYDQRQASRKKTIKKDKELVSGAGMGDDAVQSDAFNSMDINGVAKSDTITSTQTFADSRVSLTEEAGSSVAKQQIDPSSYVSKAIHQRQAQQQQE